MASDDYSHLIVGFDDSNHAGSKPQPRGEFIVSVFSFNPEDGIPRHQSGNRDYAFAENWMKEGGDYRFTVLLGYDFRSSFRNLPFAAPCLLRNYLESTGLDKTLQSIDLNFDGVLMPEDRNNLIATLRESYPSLRNISAQGFTKKGKTKGGKLVKMNISPGVVYIADVWSNMIFSRWTAGKAMTDDRLVNIPPEQLQQREEWIRKHLHR